MNKRWTRPGVWLTAMALCMAQACEDRADNRAQGATGPDQGATSAELSSQTKAVGQKGSDKAKASAPTSEEPGKPPAQGRPQPTAPSLPNGLLVSYAQFEIGKDGKATAKPGPARLEIMRQERGEWKVDVLEDRDSNVLHKAMFYEPLKGPPGILTFSGTKAAVKLWRHSADGFRSETLWQEDFGGRFSRMRDAEVADLYGQGHPAIAIGTHDQGVVAVLQPKPQGGYQLNRLGAKADTFIHEIEIGDLDGDKVLEVYATPSEPNRLDGTEQHGTVIRYLPRKKKGPEIVADLGNRHAKEIYVGDVDGDGRDELYAAVEALTEGKRPHIRLVQPVEIRRYDKDTEPDKGKVVATLQDRFCRFLTVGDVDGDGRKEMAAAAYRSGVWLLRPPSDPSGSWQVTSIDHDSSGFEHAALMADLNEDGRDELYVAADEQGELRRYTWQNGSAQRQTIHRREIPGSMMTWNIMPFPVARIY